LSRFAIGLDDLANVVRDVKDIVSKTPTAFPIQGILLRFSDATDIYMSTAYGKQSVHFEFYEWKRKNYYKDSTGSLAGYQTILQTLVHINKHFALFIRFKSFEKYILDTKIQCTESLGQKWLGVSQQRES